MVLQKKRKKKNNIPFLCLRFTCACEKQSCRKEEVFDDNFSYFSSKPYVVTPHLNCPIEMVQIRGHNICFYAELTKIICNVPPNTRSYPELWISFTVIKSCLRIWSILSPLFLAVDYSIIELETSSLFRKVVIA